MKSSCHHYKSEKCSFEGRRGADRETERRKGETNDWPPNLVSFRKHTFFLREIHFERLSTLSDTFVTPTTLLDKIVTISAFFWCPCNTLNTLRRRLVRGAPVQRPDHPAPILSSSLFSSHSMLLGNFQWTRIKTQNPASRSVDHLSEGKTQLNPWPPLPRL